MTKFMACRLNNNNNNNKTLKVVNWLLKRLLLKIHCLQ